MLKLLGEVIAYLPEAIKLGVDVSDTVQRAIALVNAPTPATDEELATFKEALDAEKAKLAVMTAELNKDP